MTLWQPLTRRESYLPIEDHGLIGDGRGCALVGRDAEISFMCVPRFDQEPLFCSLLDRRHGGGFRLSPQGVRQSRQRYVDDTAVLVTELRTDTGVVEITDAFLLRVGARLEEDAPAAAGELVRRARVTHGEVTVHLQLEPRGGAHVRRRGEEWLLDCGRQGVALRLSTSRSGTSPDCKVTLPAGEELVVRLCWDDSPSPYPTAEAGLEATLRAWERWASLVVADVPRPDLVRRSALTLKLLDYVENGAIIAAPTSSLPEHIGGSRNWDYRYAWIRDAAFTVFALRRIGLPSEAGGFLDWALTAARHNHQPRVLYDVDGNLPPPEAVDEGLEGYRGSAPVRWGNAAAEQTQHDVYGEILDCAFQWAATGGTFDDQLWKWLAGLAERAAHAWRTPDHGIWEVRTSGRPFTYSAAMCQVALDRAARLADRLKLPGDAERWARQADHLTERILHHAWDDRVGALTEDLGDGSALDASLLALPLRRVVPADHPKMAATCRAITEQLGAGDGLLYRYLPERSPDGLHQQQEGAFLLCSFWLVDNLMGQGHVERAGELFESLCSRTNHLGLLPEQIDPSDGTFLGNFPQAISHVGLVSSAVALARAARGAHPELSTGAWFT
ncbi:glycoside hydrolase family 15 protein [Streptomyces sp. TRM68416]|uniref:glycoside hydrolase family 15 protein n=1 Tax=Streptomyces sp. TRM68416 TaxID=2758412 RepID=UPI00166204A9|nr:glycoside hydrolase family 15 protein [Streptomyces sp. TRM68416]MBD0841329.1 glycoside hydrolase family 15 protein [Streptomyces sp. TRM68416]